MDLERLRLWLVLLSHVVRIGMLVSNALAAANAVVAFWTFTCLSDRLIIHVSSLAQLVLMNLVIVMASIFSLGVYLGLFVPVVHFHILLFRQIVIHLPIICNSSMLIVFLHI